MTKTQSGLVMIGVSIFMSMVANLIPKGNDVSLAFVRLIIMFASAVLLIFGLYRAIAGAREKK